LSPGVLAVFVFGLLVRRAPGICGVAGLATNFIAYGGMKYLSTISGLMDNKIMSILIGNFLNRMAISFVICLLVMLLIRMTRPLAQPIEFKQQTTIELHSSKGAIAAGIIVVIITLILYVIFSPLCLAK
jgi:SSS family solute:Na+ symporter